jgi:hypothetical protein
MRKQHPRYGDRENGKEAEPPGRLGPPVWLFTDAALKKYQSLTKAQSLLITQVRTGAIGLRAFLFKVKAPEALTLLCACGEGPETAEHLVVWCKNPPKNRLWEGKVLKSRADFYWAFRGASGRARRLAKKLADWLMESGRLLQYRLAIRLAREDSDELE